MLLDIAGKQLVAGKGEAAVRGTIEFKCEVAFVAAPSARHLLQVLGPDKRQAITLQTVLAIETAGAANRLLSVVEVDDLIQEVSTAAITSLDSTPLDDYEPMQWLQQIARRRVVDAHRFHFDAQRRDAGRRQSIHAPADAGVGDGAVGIEHMIAASMTSPSAAMSRDIRMHRLQQAIENLAEEQKTAVRLRYVDGLPTKQIAEQLGKTDVAVRVLLSRSMRLLEKQLDDVKPTR